MLAQNYRPDHRLLQGRVHPHRPVAGEEDGSLGPHSATMRYGL